MKRTVEMCDINFVEYTIKLNIFEGSVKIKQTARIFSSFNATGSFNLRVFLGMNQSCFVLKIFYIFIKVHKINCCLCLRKKNENILSIYKMPINVFQVHESVNLIREQWGSFGLLEMSHWFERVFSRQSLLVAKRRY